MKAACNWPGCPEVIKAGERFCQEHWKKHWAKQTKSRNTKEGKKDNRFYSSQRWRNLRKRVLSDEPFCRHCKEKGIIQESQEVDHIDGDRTNNSRSNLQGLCKSCHSAKTIKELGLQG